MGKSKKVSTVTMVNDPTANPATKLTKGHYRCDCQARSHALIHNCLNCGRIVCAQEGSGPCFFCGELVVSREEREILENGSNTQRKKLMMALTGKSGDASLSTMSTDFQRAQTFRDNLLRADADMERQKKVDDLDSDYHNIEQSSHLTAEERAAIIKRKEELVELDKARQRQVIVSISAEGEVTEQKQARVTAETDPIIRAIVQNSLNRKQTVTTANARRKPVDESFNAKDFTPFYNKEYSRNVDKEANCRNRELLNREDILLQANEEMLHHEIEKEGYCIAFDQPFATVALTENIEYLPWHEETSVRGPVFVAASTRIPNDKEIEHVKKIYGLKSIPKAGDLSIGAILGRLIIDQCWKTEDFIDELGGNSRKRELVNMSNVEETRPEPAAAPAEENEIGAEEMYLKQLAIKSAVGVVAYPLTLVKTLFQLGYEPYPLTRGKSLLVAGRTCYFLPNGFVYARYLYNDVGFWAMFTGVESAVLANVTGGIVSFAASKYLDKYYPNVGGKPENLGKEEKDMSDHESFRVMVRTATRETLSRTIGLVVSRPFTVFMTRKIAQLISEELKYTDPLSCFYRIGREEGPAGFFSGIVPQLIAEAITIWGLHTFAYAIERTLIYAEIDKHDEKDEAARDHAAHTRRLLHFAVPFFVNAYAYPFQVVSTVMATVGSGLAVSMLPYAPTFSIWQDAWHYLQPHGLRRGARLFLREQKGAVTVGSDNNLYANYKHFA